jgi:DNA-binding winged helix-turn-helix (wHTH) protein
LSPVRFRFAEFVVSPARRVLLREGAEVPLIPRYFDLLVLLLQRRGQAVHRRDIFEHVWNDVVVSDGALSQAIRTLRRALGDDSHDPTYIRTVSRHGYRFAFPEVVEELDADLAADVSVAPDTARAASRRETVANWASGTAGGAGAGALAGVLGGVALLAAPGSAAPASLPVVLSAVGALVGALGAAGVGAGLAIAEVFALPRRVVALVALGAAGGGVIGFLGQHLARWTLQGLFGRDLQAVGGAFEGVWLGAAAGLGYGLATSWPAEGSGRPRSRRLRAALAGAFACGAAALLATAAGANLTGVSLNTLARAFQGSQVQLAPVARLLGEAELGPVTRGALAVYEGALFGFGFLFGFTRRPR